jgi:Cohesin domain/Secretion system C-terminal sorting domain
MFQLRHLSLFAILAFLSSTPIVAQNVLDSVYVYVPALTSGAEGQSINIPVKVRRFKNLVSAQLSIKWDSTVVQYIGVDNFGLSTMTLATHFGTNGTRPDKINLSWVDNNITPQTIADDNSLFNIKFKLIGKKDQSTPLLFSNDFFEFLNVDSKDARVGYANGVVSITKSIAVGDSPFKGGVAAAASPNPFHDETSIQLELTENQDITIRIFDLTGKNIYSQTSMYEVGTQFVRIDKNNIQESGTYFYRLETSTGESISGKLIKI